MSAVRESMAHRMQSQAALTYLAHTASADITAVTISHRRKYLHHSRPRVQAILLVKSSQSANCFVWFSGQFVSGFDAHTARFMRAK